MMAAWSRSARNMANNGSSSSSSKKRCQISPPPMQRLRKVRGGRSGLPSIASRPHPRHLLQTSVHVIQSWIWPWKSRRSKRSFGQFIGENLNPSIYKLNENLLVIYPTGIPIYRCVPLQFFYGVHPHHPADVCHLLGLEDFIYSTA